MNSRKREAIFAPTDGAPNNYYKYQLRKAARIVCHRAARGPLSNFPTVPKEDWKIQRGSREYLWAHRSRSETTAQAVNTTCPRRPVRQCQRRNSGRLQVPRCSSAGGRDAVVVPGQARHPRRPCAPAARRQVRPPQLPGSAVDSCPRCIQRSAGVLARRWR